MLLNLSDKTRPGAFNVEWHLTNVVDAFVSKIHLTLEIWKILPSQLSCILHFWTKLSGCQNCPIRTLFLKRHGLFSEPVKSFMACDLSSSLLGDKILRTGQGMLALCEV